MSTRKSLAEIVEDQIAEGRVALPVFDQTAMRIQEMIDKGEFDPGRVEKLVATDPALSGNLLRHANSSFFGGIEKVVTTRDAIVRLGVKQVAELVILASQEEQYDLADPGLKKLAQQLWPHAVACGVGCRWLARRLDMADRASEAFLAGLLHDIGKLLVLRVLDELMSTRKPGFQPSEGLVLQLLDGLHCAQGHSLMQEWNIPEVYQKVVLGHHDESSAHDDALLGVVRLVDTVCNRLGIGLHGKVDVNVAASPDAQRLRVSEIALDELEVRLEDSLRLAQQ